MTDFMEWLYINSIEPYIKNQVPDNSEARAISLFESEFTPTQKEDLEDMLSFYGVHGFRLGLKVGMALAQDLH